MGTRTNLLEVGARARRAVVLGVLITTAIAAVDLLLGADVVLIGPLVVGALVTCAIGGPRATALVAAYALALGIALGTEGDMFMSGDHLGRVVTIVLGGALAVWIASLRAAREDDSIRLGIQYAVARILSESDTLEDAAPRLLAAIAGPLGWELAAMWEGTGPDELRCVAVWKGRELESDAFRTATRDPTLRPGAGLPGQVWASRAPVWFEDVSEIAELPRRDAAEAAGLRGAVGVRIRAGGDVSAALELFSTERRERDAGVSELLVALAAQIGEFLESVTAQAAVRESEARKTAVLDSALDCVITIDHRGIVMEFNAAAERTFGYRADEAIGRELAQLIVPPPLRERHRAALRRNVETDESSILGRPIELVGMRADGSEFPVELAVNRIAGSEPPIYTGTLRDITERKHAESEREELLRLEQLARRDATRARDQLDAILSGVADAVTAQAPDGSLLFANDAAVRTLGFSSTDELMSAAVDEIVARFDILDEHGLPFPTERLPGRRALVDGVPGEALVRFRWRDSGEERWSMVKATPILDAQGAVTMAINVIEDITAHKRAEVQQRFLAESSRVLASSLDPDETIKRVAALAVPEIADWVAVDMRAHGGGVERLALAHADPALIEKAEQLRLRYPPDPRSTAGVFKVFREGASELYREIPDELLRAAAVDDEHLALIREFGLRSAMLVPMWARDEVIGVLTLASGPSGRRFDEQDLALTEELARRCAVAIDNARLYNEHAYIARTLQESLLPIELPEIPGMEAAARFRPTGAGTEVGGDFYDLFESGGRGWTVVVGDVCGKGPDAAAVTALARYTLRAAAMHERLPSRSLRMLNEALLRQRADRRFCTVAYAYLEAEDGGARLGFSSGGHPLPLLLRTDGAVEPLGAHGTLLGVVEEPDLADHSATLAAGEAIVFYTDGVTEPPGAYETLGEERLRDVVASCAGLGADAIAATIEAEALRAQDGSPRDDIAVVVLRVAG